MKVLKFFVLPLLCLLMMQFVKAENPKIYEIYNRSGKKVTYEEFIKEVSNYNVVLFGEMHNCPVVHWLEKRVAKDLYQSHKDDLMLGAEMFERDNQLILDEYLNSKISEERFEAEARLWPNYGTDYMPLVDFAKDNKIAFVATNIPRRYARIVRYKGFEGLEAVSDEAKNYFAPLPIPYQADTTQNNFFAMMSQMGHKKSNPEFMAQAQAIKDATMAWFLVKNLDNKYFLHFNGSYHSDSPTGLPYYIKEYAPNLKVVTISSARQENIESLDEINIGRADFIIVITEDFSYSY